MTIDKIEVYRTKDGELWEDITDAKIHSLKLDLETALINNPILGDQLGCCVEFDQLLDWLIDNKELREKMGRYSTIGSSIFTRNSRKILPTKSNI